MVLGVDDLGRHQAGVLSKCGLNEQSHRRRSELDVIVTAEEVRGTVHHLEREVGHRSVPHSITDHANVRTRARFGDHGGNALIRVGREEEH